MAQTGVHAAAEQPSAEEHPVAAETAAIPAADIQGAVPAETAEDIPAVAKVLAAVVVADIPVEEAARPAEAGVAEEDILVAEAEEAEVPEAVEGTATNIILLMSNQREPAEEVERSMTRQCS